MTLSNTIPIPMVLIMTEKWVSGRRRKGRTARRSRSSPSRPETAIAAGGVTIEAAAFITAGGKVKICKMPLVTNGETA
jgi:hypothetical protein